MTTSGDIEAALRRAMLDRNQKRTSILKMLKTALQYEAIKQSNKDLPDEAAQIVLKKEQKKRIDAAKLYVDNAQPEMAAKEREEAGVIAEFLPEPLSEEKTIALVQAAIAELAATQPRELGQVIALVKQKTDGRADSSLVAMIAKSKLTNQ